MRTLLALLLTISIGALNAQPYMRELIKVTNSQEYGNMRPRIEVVDGQPTVYWMQSGSKLWLNHRTSDSTFSDPANLNGADHSIFVSNYGGSDIAVRDSVIFLTYMTLPYLQAKVYLKKSVDYGASWSDPELIALPDSVIPFVPTVAVDQLGDPTLMIMAYDQNYHNPEWITMRSFDGGATFNSMVSASANAPHEVCDCCPANLNVHVDQVIATFRNNDQNIRDIWVATSHDWGASYDTVLDVDPGNWNIASCPSSGPDAYYDGYDAHSTWMSSGSGSAKVYYSAMNSFTYGFQSRLIYEGGGNQNFPRIAGNGDTLGLVFQNSESGINNCLFLYSTNGGNNWSDPIDVFGDSTSFQRSPDISFENGSFHIIFNDLFSSSIYYREISFNPPAGISSIVTSALRLFPNPTDRTLNIDPMPQIGTSIAIRNPLGQVVLLDGYRGPLDVQHLQPGLYSLELDGEVRWFVVE